MAETASEEPSDWTWQVSLGLSAWGEKSLLKGSPGNSELPVLPTLQVDVSYKNFFVETPSRRVTNLSHYALWGYHLYQDEQWQLDIINGSYMPMLDESGYSQHGVDVIEELRGIRDRDSDGSLGLRLQRFDDQQHYSIEIVRDFSNAYNDFLLQAYYNYVIQARNWDIQLTLGLNLYSRALVDYYFGIRPFEATPTRPVYKGKAAYRLHLGVSSLYPINENWLLELGFGVNQYSRGVSDSPIVASDMETLGMVNVRYVF
ncbi:hypothetical protein GCM10010982_03940 [Bowmanella pacifica]|uniref:MipA/OmpV family protein n=3 Tax=Bowmanella TaxID=366580 RepID=A0A917YQX6_9ALTE|nr:hypothetical protein GCM10010982_03940 [Bowmanella pacifica]